MASDCARAILKPRIAASVPHYPAEGPQAANVEAAAEKGQESWLSANVLRQEFLSNVTTRRAGKLAEVVFSERAADGIMVGKEGTRHEEMEGIQPDWKSCTPRPPSYICHSHAAVSRSQQSQWMPAGGRRAEGELQPQLRPRAPTSHRLNLGLQTASSGNKFSSELRRFFAALVQADYRLLGRGQAFGHRVQVFDCTPAQQLCLHNFTHSVYAELAAVLGKIDPWEVRFEELEEFVAAAGRLPRQNAKLMKERSLGNWLCKQGKRFRASRLVPHRFDRLINASSTLVRERVQRWLDPQRAFGQKCQELREYILASGSLPVLSQEDSAGRKLAFWLYACIRQGRLAEAERKILEEVHPLVKARLCSWANVPARVSTSRWKRQRACVARHTFKGRPAATERE